MNIVLEGPDNAGKSTIAQALSQALKWPIKDKEGRPPTPILMAEKFRKYEALDHMIIDRHPIISQSIYGHIRGEQPILDEFTDNFFNRRDLIIYCRCIQKGLDGHEPSDTDTDMHLDMIEQDYKLILNTYDNWAAICADIIYKDWRDMEMIVAMVKGALHERG